MILNTIQSDTDVIVKVDLVGSAQVEVDFSLPMLHSVCNSFNTQTQLFTNLLNGICIHLLKTLLHICSAHIMNRFSYKIERNLTERPVA